MLFSQRKSPAFPSHPPPSFGIGALGHASTSDSAASAPPPATTVAGDPPSSSSQQQHEQHLELTTTTSPTSPSTTNTNTYPSASSTTPSSGSAFVDSPTFSSPDPNTPLPAFTTTTTITATTHGPETITQAWSYGRGPSVAPKWEFDDSYSSSRGLSQQHSIDTVFKQTSPASPSSHTTVAFTTVTSAGPSTEIADDDDVIPKVEEVDDNEPLSISIPGENERLMDVDSQPPNSEDTSPVDANQNPDPPPKRKRGRPRKHPLPTPGQTKAAAKGRSKTGCATCRRRKKKCDETKPACLNCQKNAVVCEGYPVREIWKSGKQKVEEARRNSLASLPRGLPILIDGIETETDRRFLDHFVYDFSRVLTLINDDSNPFKEILLPMAAQHRGLMHSLMCLSGSHLSAQEPDSSLKERKHYHFARAIADLRTTIMARSSPEQSSLPVDDPTIASTIALCLNTICEGETQGEYRSHMDAARYLLATHRPQNESFRKFIVEFFQYHDVSNSLTTLDRRPICLTGDLRLPDFVPHAQAGALLGIFDGLFRYISEITVLRDRIRQHFLQGREPAVDYETLSEAVSIDSAIRSWEPIYPQDDPNWSAAQLYRQSTWVYLYRTIRPSQPCEKISQVVDDGLLYLDQLPLNTGPYSILLMPLFLLGCSAFEPRQRERIKAAFDSLQAYSNLRNIEPALTIVEKVWEIMDTGGDDSWDWEKIIDDMGMDFLIT